MSKGANQQQLESNEARRINAANAMPLTSFKPLADPSKLNGLKAERVEELLGEGGRVSRLVYDDLVRIFVAAKIPITLWGAMGSGKTRGVEAFAKETDENGVPYQVITIQPSTEDPTMIGGLMVVQWVAERQEHVMSRSIPDPVQNVIKYYEDTKGLTIMFLDEMTTCSPMQQNALLGLLTHAKYGTTDISPYVTFVMAANPPGTVQTVLPLSEAVINRGGHIPWFSERDHFLGKWTKGFGDPLLVPQRRTANFLTMLIDSRIDAAFRHDPEHVEQGEEGWDIDHLCPYEQMHFSERAATEVAKVYQLIRDCFRDAPFSIRQLYIREAITAMVGPSWGRNAAEIEKLLEHRQGIEPALDAVRRYGINEHTPIERVRELVGNSLHMVGDDPMTEDQELEIVEQFAEEIFAGGEFGLTQHLAFCVWLSTFTSARTREAVMRPVSKIFLRAVSEFLSTVGERALKPDFLPDDVIELVLSRLPVSSS